MSRTIQCTEDEWSRAILAERAANAEICRRAGCACSDWQIQEHPGIHHDTCPEHLAELIEARGGEATEEA